jgi:signal transduction histidine kinase/integral membrane sensor domain MASE1
MIDAQRSRPLLTAAILTALGYYAGVQIGLALRFTPLTTSVLWPPNSILTAALLLVPVRHWWVCLLAALPVHVLPELQAGFAPPAVGLLFLTNCSEALLAAGGLRLLSDSPSEFNTLRRVVLFIGVAGVAAPVLSSFADAAVVHLVRGEPYWLVWRVRTFGNILTELSVVPAVVLLCTAIRRRERPAIGRVLEALILAGLVTCTAAWVFGGVIKVAGVPRTPTVLIMPLLFWAAIRFGVSGASVSLLLAALTASYESNLGHRPFESLPPMESLLAVQMYLAVMAVPVMYIAGLLEERRRVAADLAARLRFEGLLSAVGGAFVRQAREAAPSAFDEALQRLGEFYRLDYVALLETQGQDGTVAIARQWRQPGSAALIGAKCAADFPWVFDRVLHGDTIVIESLADFPGAARADRDAFQRYGLHTGVLLPLISGNRVHGVLSLVTLRPHHWSAADRTQLQLVAEILGNASARWQAEVEVQQARQELSHLARLSSMGELTASLAHQLNQPLTGILNNAEAARMFLDSGQASATELREILGDIVEDNQRAADVIRRVREMVTRTTPSPVELDANALVRTVATLIASDAVMRNVSVSFDIAGKPLAITGNRVDLEQALLNVVTNAMEAVSDRPVSARHVVVTTALNGSGHVQIVVHDDGPGFTNGAERRIFEPFVSGKPDGMGMGLAVARSVIDQHGGTITAANHPRGGAVVTIAIPAVAAASV